MRSGDGRFTILVADDSVVYRKLVERTLELDCYSLVFAKSGLSALELFEKHRPSLVITDWMMPDFTGIELCQRIRGSAQDSYCYIIIVTGISEKENVVKGLAAGADDAGHERSDKNRRPALDAAPRPARLLVSGERVWMGHQRNKDTIKKLWTRPPSLEMR
jgi:CheY-like chemotaxis protein